MAEIEQTITQLPVVAGRFDSDFIETADNFLNQLPGTCVELNNFALQTNAVAQYINELKEDTNNLYELTNNLYENVKTTAYSSVNFLGEWELDVEYKVPASVVYNNNVYLAKKDNENKQPDIEQDFWVCVTDYYTRDTIDAKIKMNDTTFDVITIPENKNTFVAGPVSFNKLIIENNSTFKII
jgi:hypothetical protein